MTHDEPREQTESADEEIVETEADSDVAYLLALLRVYQEKARVLFDAPSRTYWSPARRALSRLTKGRFRPLQVYEEFVKIADARARRLSGVRSLGQLGLLASGQVGDVPVSGSEIASLHGRVSDLPLFNLWTRDWEARWRDSSKSSRQEKLQNVLEAALKRRRPFPAERVKLHAVDLVREQSFRSRVLTSVHRERLHAESPLVSIVMPTRNRDRLLRGAVQSVLEQTYRRWELWIIDDGDSVEATRFCTALAAEDKRVNYLRNDGRGAAAARNSGLRRATGDFVAYLDDDNQWVPDYLEIMLIHARMESATFCYSSMQLIDKKGSKAYFGQPFDFTTLQIENYIDMNIVMHSRKLIDEAGIFDESLPRTIDWDFIIRLCARGRVAWAPFVGAIYSDDTTRADRITVSQKFSWRYHVINRYYPGWSELEQDRLGCSIILNAHGKVDVLEASLLEILASRLDTGFQVIIVDNGISDEGLERVFVWEGMFPCIRLVHMPQPLGQALAYNIGAQCARGEHLVFRSLGVHSDGEWLKRLLAPLSDDSIGMVQATILYPDGDPYSTGYSWSDDVDAIIPDRRQFQPAGAANATAPAAAVSLECAAMRRSDFFRLRGFEPLYTASLFDVDLGLRISEHLGKSSVVLGTAVVLQEPTEPQINALEVQASRELFVANWKERVAALKVSATKSGEALRIPDNKLFLDRGVALSSQILLRAKSTDPIQFSIKIACPSKAESPFWGDFHFAQSLSAALSDLGHRCRIDMATEWYRGDRNTHDDVVIVLRGLYAYRASARHVNLMWLISHPSRVKIEELGSYDHVFVASEAYAQRISESAKLSMSPLLQCTDPRIFSPASAPSTSDRIVFVGNSRGVQRPIIAAATQEAIPVEIYGGGWREFSPPGLIKAEKVSNEEVGELYRAAGVVLNDHWKDMKVEGFISNRLFDAGACAVPIVSDFVPGIGEVFDGLVNLFDPAQPLKPTIEHALAESRALRSRREALARKIREQHSFQARAQEIVQVAESLLRDRRKSAPVAHVLKERENVEAREGSAIG